MGEVSHGVQRTSSTKLSHMSCENLLEKMTEGNIEQHVLHSATYDEHMVVYPENTNPVHEGYCENHRHSQRREHPSLFPLKTTR